MTIDAIDTAIYPRLPAWVKAFRPDQERAVDEIVDAFTRVPVVILEAPTGAGKTLIAEMVRRRVYAGAERASARGVYSCTTKSLQHQFRRDFDSANLMGRSNYPTEWGGEDVTAEDCTGRGGAMCLYCSGPESCPYQCAVSAFRDHELGVTNLAYLMATMQIGRRDMRPVHQRGLLVIDEADELEGLLVDRAGLGISSRMMADVGVQPLKKGVHAPTIAAWLDEFSTAAREWARLQGERVRDDDVKMIRKIGRVKETAVRALLVRRDFAIDPNQWVRNYDDRTNYADNFKLAPVRVGKFGKELLWGGVFDAGCKVLVMSASILAPEQWAEDVGLIVGDEIIGQHEYVEVPMRFPAENRRIIASGVADLKRGGAEDEPWDVRAKTMARAIGRVLELHEGNVLVHTVSYKLSELVTREIRATARATGRKVHTYTRAADREQAIEDFKLHGGVLVASSLERGVDLAGDLCRVQVICKVPFPNLGDRRVAARSRLPGGERWYATQTARSLVQMTGRGVRNEQDHAVTVILDKGFMRWWSQWKSIMPAWWAEAVQIRPSSTYAP